MKTIRISNVSKRVTKVRKLMRSIGTNIGSCWFIKRGDNKLRKMAYRVAVYNPTYARRPTNKKKKNDNTLMTVFDTNEIRYNRQGRMCGRGGYKSIPLDSIIRLKVNGKIYKIKA